MHSYKTGKDFSHRREPGACLRSDNGKQETSGVGGGKGGEETRRLCSWQWRTIIEHAANFRNICTQLSLLNTDCILRREWLFNLSPLVTPFFPHIISHSECHLSDPHYTNAPPREIRVALINDLAINNKQ